MPDLLLWLALAANLAAFAYVLAALGCVQAFRQGRGEAGTFRPPATILKPVCGLEEGLYENLRSFCVQDYPAYQVVFGVRDAGDPAVPVIRRLIAELPGTHISLVIEPAVSGPNLKVSNLANMLPAARHDLLVVSDSDMRVGPDYLASVAAPFEDPGVGLVTCLYSGRPGRGLASLLGAMFIDDQFLPAVLVRARLGPVRFGLGATLALRRDLLERIGGFQRLVGSVADDHVLGRLIAGLGFRVVLSRYVVEALVVEPDLAAMLRHELRWSRTVRTVEPLGHAFSFVMYGVPVAIIGAALLWADAGRPMAGAGLVLLAVMLRMLLHGMVARRLSGAATAFATWLVPLRDVLNFFVWFASFFGRSMVWRDRRLAVGADGLVRGERKIEA